MIALTYVSIAERNMTKEEMLELLSECVRKNRLLEITGMLLYKDGKFLQMLEGPADVVRAKYGAIEKDRRHHTVIKLLDREIKERQFPKWTMGFRDLNEIRADGFPGYSGFLSEEPVGQVFPLDPERANKLLHIFSEA